MSELLVGDNVILLKELHLNIGSVKYMRARYLPGSFLPGTIGEIKSLDGEDLAAVDFGSCTAWAKIENLCSVKSVVEQASAKKVVVQVKPPTGWCEVPRYADPKWHLPEEREYHGILIAPEPVIPWGAEYDAVLPGEADDRFDQYYVGGTWEKWMSIKGQDRSDFPWRRRKSPKAQVGTPVGWIFGGNAKNNPEGAPCPNYESFWIIPDTSIPWELEKYHAILPTEVAVGDEWYGHGKWRKLTIAETMWLEGFPWRRLKTYSLSEVKEMQKAGDVQQKLDLQWEAAKAVEQERNELQKKVEELSAKVALLTETNTSLCEKIKSLEGSFTEAGTLSIGKAGISVSLGEHVLLAHKATHTLYIREVKQ